MTARASPSLRVRLRLADGSPVTRLIDSGHWSLDGGPEGRIVLGRRVAGGRSTTSIREGSPAATGRSMPGLPPGLTHAVACG